MLKVCYEDGIREIRSGNSSIRWYWRDSQWKLFHKMVLERFAVETLPYDGIREIRSGNSSIRWY